MIPIDTDGPILFKRKTPPQSQTYLHPGKAHFGKLAQVKLAESVYLIRKYSQSERNLNQSTYNSMRGNKHTVLLARGTR